MTRNDSNPFKRLLLSLIVLLALGAAGVGVVWTWRSRGARSGEADSPPVYKVKRRDLTISVVQEGDIQARSYTDYVCEVEGRPSIVEIVPEGEYISPEDVARKRILVTLDTAEITERLTQQKILFASAEASYTNAKEALSIQENQNQSDLKAAELAVKFALMDLQKYLSEKLADDLIGKAKAEGAKPDKVIEALVKELVANPNDPRWGGAALQAKRDLEAKIKLAKGTLEQDKNRLRGTQRLHEKEYVAATELERDRLALQRSEIDVQQAETALRLFLQYDLPKEAEKLFSDYQEAQRQQERTKARARAILAQARAKLNSAHATYDLQTERLDKLKVQLDACIIRAVSPGLVMYGTSTNYEARRRDPIEIGDIVHKGQKIITVPNSDEVSGIVRVHESWVERVHRDLPVRITADPLPDKVFLGKVESVAPLPDPQSRYGNTGLKVYTTHVSIEGKQLELRPGMSAKIEIVVDELTNVLCVPLQAVASRGGLKLCYVVTDDGLEARPVETGQFNDSFIEIKSGLAVGENVSLVPPSINGQEEDDQEDEKDKDKGKPTPKAPSGGASTRPAPAKPLDKPSSP